MTRSVRSIVSFGLIWAVACGTPESSNEAPPEPAESAARLLAPGVVSTGEAADELQPSIAADGRTLYFARRVPDGRFTLFAARRAADAGDHYVLDDPDAWDEPEMLPFSGTYDDQEPFISADGRRLYFTSNRPAPGSDERNRGREPWVVEWREENGGGWGTPRPLGPGLTLERPDDPELSRFWGQPRGPVEGPDGALYFWAEQPDTRGHTDLYRVEPDSAGGYGDPVNLGAPVNSERYETGVAFAPGGSWIIFGRDEDDDGYGLGDLYISHRTGDGWTGVWGEPRNLGPLVNTSAFDASPAVTPDGRFLLFSSNRSTEGEGSGRHNIYVIELERLGASSRVTTSGRVYELAGGLWWTGDGFEERTMYSVGGVFASERPAAVDSVIDLNGLYIVPPFAEAHTHTIAYVRSRIDEFLEDGVFYALVMNVHRSAIGRNFTWFGRLGSVDVNFTSLGVTASDGHPIQIGLRGNATVEDVDGDWVTIIESREDIEKKWPALRDANPDFIKLFLLYSDRYAERHGDTTVAPRYKGMDPSLVPSLVERAHAAGLRVAAHVRTAHDFRVAVEAGVDIIAHLPGFSMRMPAYGEGESESDGENPDWFRIRPEDAALAAERGITVIPTIGSLGSVPDTLAPDRAARARTFLDTRRDIVSDNLRLLREHGVRIAIGSDAGEGSPVTEALVMHELGVFTEAELLNMLTEHAARVTFPRRSVGRLNSGYEASFLALAADPTARFGHVRDVELRFKQGTPLMLGTSP